MVRVEVPHNTAGEYFVEELLSEPHEMNLLASHNTAGAEK